MIRKSTIALIVATLTFGIILGARFRNKYIQKSKALESITAVTNLTDRPRPRKKVETNHAMIKDAIVPFVVQFRESLPMIKEDDAKKIEIALKSSHNSMHLIALDKDTIATLRNPAAAAGCIAGTRFIKIREKGPKLKPLYFGSGDPKFEMYNESQVISTGDISSLADLNNKTIGIELLNISEAVLILNDLNLKKIRAKKIIVFKDHKKALSELVNKKIDSLIARVHVYSNGRIESALGLVEKDHFFQYPQLKIIHTTNYKIPWRIIFVSETLARQNARELTKRVESFFEDPKYKDLRKLMGVVSVSKANTEAITAIEKIVHGSESVTIKSLASEVVEVN